jgi:hypothetical protein
VEVAEEAGREDNGDGGGPLGWGQLGRVERGEVIGHVMPSGGAGRGGRPYEGTTPGAGDVSDVGV